MARRRRDDGEDDEDDRPRKRRRDDDEDDEDERPRKKRRDDDSDIPAGTPRVYVHEECKAQTKMPAAAVREYLENPFELGEQPETHCSGCEDDVPWKECYWAETKQNLYEYIDDMRAEMLLRGEDPRPGVGYAWWYPIGGAIGLGLAVGAGGRKALGLGLVPGLIAAAVGALGGAIYMLIEYRGNVKEQEAWNAKLLKRYYKRHPEAKQAKKKRRRSDEDDE